MWRKPNVFLFFMLSSATYLTAMDGLKSAVAEKQSFVIEGDESNLSGTGSAKEIRSLQTNNDELSEQIQQDVQLIADLDSPSYRENPLFIDEGRDTKSDQIESVKWLLKTSIGLRDMDEEGRYIVLCKAVSWGEKELVQMLIAAGVNVNKTFRNGISPIIAGILAGQTQIVRILIDAGARAEDIDEDGYNALHLAVLKQSESMVKELIASGINLNRKSHTGETALHIAVLNGQIDIVKMLIGAGADRDVANESGWTALFKAVSRGDQKIVQVLIAAGVNVNKKTNDGVSPIVSAILSGFAEIVTLLIDAGAEAEDLDEHGYNALHCAVLKGLESVVQALIASRVDLEKKCPRGETALHIAAREGCSQIVELLVKAGANLCPEDNNGFTPLLLAIICGQEHVCAILAPAESIRYNGLHSGTIRLFSAVQAGNKKYVDRYIGVKLSVDGVDLENVTLLHWAAYQGFVEIAQILVSAGIKLNETDKKGNSPLVYAAAKGHGEIAKMLIEAGAAVDVYEADGWSVLHHAAGNGLEEVVRLLLSKGVSANLLTKDGFSPLYLAFRFTKIPIVRLLINAGADINNIDEFSNTLLHMCAKLQLYEPDLLRLGVSRNIDVNTMNELPGLTPLQYAAGEGHIETVKWLLRAGADVNLRHNSAEAPLHFAARRGDLEITKLLLAARANVYSVALIVIRAQGSYLVEYKTALSEAVENGHPEVVECLLDVGANLRDRFLKRLDKEVELSLLQLLTGKVHDKVRCKCWRVMKILMQKGVKLSTIKESLYQHIRSKKQAASSLDSVIMFQLIGPGLYKK